MSPTGPFVKKVVGVLMGLLTLEFVLGMLVNLFGDPGEGHESPLYMKAVFFTHAIIGLLLLIGAIYILYYGLRIARGHARTKALLGSCAVFVAFAAGIATVGLQDNASEIASFTMAMGFLVAVTSYGRLIGLIPMNPPHEPTAAPAPHD